MALCLYYNNANSTLAGAITSSATSINLAAGGGAQFSPAPTTGQYFCLTLVSAADTANQEIVHCTAVSGDTLTIVRGQEGTAPLAFSAGDLVYNYFTAGSATALVQTTQLQQQQGNYAQDSGAANAMVVTLSPAPASYAALNGSPVRVRVAATNTGATTLNVNGLGAATVENVNGTALSAGQLLAGSIYQFIYDSTSGTFWLISPGAVLPATGVSAGSYILINATVNAGGQVTAISSATSISISGNITSTAGTVSAVDLAFSTELSGPGISIVGGNINATSGTVTAIDLVATNAISGVSLTVSNEIVGTGGYLPILSAAYTAILNASGSTYNPLYCGLSISAQAAVIMSSCHGYLAGNGYAYIPSDQVSTGHMIVQWGLCDTGYGIGVAFPIAFPNACFGCTISEAAASNSTWGGGDTPTLHAATVASTSSFTHWTLSWNGSGWVNAANEGFFVAWGY